MISTWKRILCFFGHHDPGKWQHHKNHRRVKVCKHCGKKLRYMAIADVNVAPRDY